MRRLILFRHAEAGHRAGVADFARPLTEAGRHDAAVVARALTLAGHAPDLAVVSSARRAIETWEAASAVFPASRMELARELYEATVAELQAKVRETETGAETLMLIGHNPSMQGYALQLTGGARGAAMLTSFPPASAAVFCYEAGSPRLERLLKVKDLGGG